MPKKTSSYRGVPIEIDKKGGVAKVRVGEKTFRIRREVQIWIEEGNPFHSGASPEEVARSIIDKEEA